MVGQKGLFTAFSVITSHVNISCRAWVFWPTKRIYFRNDPNQLCFLHGWMQRSDILHVSTILTHLEQGPSNLVFLVSIYCSCATQKMMLISSSICKHNFSKLNQLQVNNFQKVSFFAILSKNLNANSTQQVEFLFKLFDEMVNKRDIRKIICL